MKKRVLDYVKKHQLITEGDHVVVGLSGGADSVCLLLLLKNIQQDIDFSMEAVHINHNLRGQEALRDQMFVENLCQKMDVKLTVESVDVAGIAKEKKLGLEEAGRQVRYEVFEKIGHTKIALAHHQNDLAETMLYHLARGTDLVGLAGIRPKRDQYIRPLLCMTRLEVEQYLAREGIDYVNDSSNQEDDYTRNKIRHHVVDYLAKEINPKSVQHMSETAQSLGELQGYLAYEGSRKFDQYGTYMNDTVTLEASLWEEPKVLVSQVIRTAFERLTGSLKDISREHTQMVYELAEKEVGKEVHLPYGLIGKKSYIGIVLKNISGADESGRSQRVGLDKEMTCDSEDICMKEAVELPMDFEGQMTWNGLQITVELLYGNLEEIPENIYTKWFDYDKINDTLVMRYRRSGDRIVVNQAGGSKKLKDYFIDQKILKEDRDKIPLLCCGQDVLWVIGHRISEGYKVTAYTKKMLKVQVLGGCYHE